MPRRRPSAVRAALPLRRVPGCDFGRIDRLPAHCLDAIARWERETCRPGATARALRLYREIVNSRYVELGYGCPCCDDYGEQRDRLDTVLNELPVKARQALYRLIEPLDEILIDRTWFNPRAHRISDWHAQEWWRQRFADAR